MMSTEEMSQITTNTRPHTNNLFGSHKIKGHKGVMIKNRSWLLKKYSGVSTTEALETAKQRFTMLAARLRKHI